MISLSYIGTGFSFIKRYVYYYMIPYMMFIYGQPYVYSYMTVVYDHIDL